MKADCALSLSLPSQAEAPGEFALTSAVSKGHLSLTSKQQLLSPVSQTLSSLQVQPFTLDYSLRSSHKAVGNGCHFLITSTRKGRVAGTV